MAIIENKVEFEVSLRIFIFMSKHLLPKISTLTFNIHLLKYCFIIKFICSNNTKVCLADIELSIPYSLSSFSYFLFP